MLRILLTSWIVLVCVGFSYSQQDQVIVPSSLSDPTIPPEVSRFEIGRTFQALKRYIDTQLEKIPKIAYGTVEIDSVGGVGDNAYDTFAVIDSFGDTVYFHSVGEWQIRIGIQARWNGGVFTYGAYPIEARTLTDYTFEVYRTSGNYWDTLQYIAVGRHRRR